MRVAAYVRVSTPAQVKLQTIDQQLESIHRYVQDKGWELPEEDVFRDDGYSGASLDRPALDLLRDKARIKGLDAVIILSPDRLARNYVHQMVLIEELEKGGCQVEFVERPMSSEPNDQLLLQIRGAVAEYERTLVKERMRRGKLAKLKAGMLLPWTRTPYGYQADPDRPRDPDGVRLDEEKAAVVAEIFAMYLEEGESLCGVANKLWDRGVSSPRGGAVWTVSSLRGILTNPVYTGQVYAGRMRDRPPRIRRSATKPIGHPQKTAVPVAPEEWIPVTTVPAIVTQEQFELAAQKLSHNKAFASRNNKTNSYLLRALVSCGKCGLACGARALRPYKYYICAGKRNRYRTGEGENCTSRYAPADQLDELVWRDLCEVLTHPESITDALQRAHGGEWLPQELKARQENLREGRAALERQLDRLTEAYLGEVIPLAEYRRRRGELEQKDEALEGQKRQLQAQADQRMELAGVADSVEDFCARVQGGLEGATSEQRRQLVELLIDRVIVADDEVEIRYVIPTDSSSEHTRFCHLRTDYSGDSGAGKSAYAERYSMWDVIRPDLSHYAYTHRPPAGIASCHSVYYKAQVSNTPKQLVVEIERRRSLVSWLVDVADRIYGEKVAPRDELLGLEDRTDFLIVDEAQRLKSSTLEQLRDLYDEGQFGLVLMSAAPNFARVLSVKGQYRSRIACVHNIKTLGAAPARKVAANPEIFGASLPPEAFSDEDALTAMVQITHGNLAYLRILTQQIEDTLQANGLGRGPGAVTTEVVEAAARSMAIGF